MPGSKPGFRPKEVLRSAQKAERSGQTRVASHHYASLSLYLRKKGKYREARALIDRAIALSPKSARLYLQKTLAELYLNNVSAARSAVELFTHYSLERKKAEVYSPYLEVQLETYPSLRKIFYETVIQVDRTSAFPFLGLAKAKQQEKDYAGALRSLVDAWKTKDRRIEVLARMKGCLRDQRHTAALEDCDHLESGKLSIEDFELKWMDPRPDVRAKKPEPISVVPVGVAEEKSLKDLIDELENELGIELKNEKDSVAPLIREFRDRSDRVLGSDSRARIDMALAFFEMQLFKDARSELSRISPTDDNYLESRCVLGEIFVAEGSDISAMEVFQAALRDERISELQKLHCWYQLAALYLRVRDYERSLENLSNIERRDPQYRDVRSLKKDVEKFLSKGGLKKAVG